MFCWGKIDGQKRQCIQPRVKALGAAEQIFEICITESYFLRGAMPGHSITGKEK